MAAPIIAMAGKKASDGAGKALTGDIYTRRWTSTRGKGKKKVAVEHELRANPVSIGLGLVAAGIAATGAGLGLWLMQRRVKTTDGRHLVLVVDETFPVDADDPGSYTVKTKRGVPYKTGKGAPNVHNMLTQHHISQKFAFEHIIDTKDLLKDGKVIGKRHWWQYVTATGKTYGIGDRSGSIFSFDGGLIG